MQIPIVSTTNSLVKYAIIHDTKKNKVLNRAPAYKKRFGRIKAPTPIVKLLETNKA